ncbi:MAG TPA: glycosyltransferase family 39 protein [Miltoncostaeaceae bacterium]|nr:glycosyltransferase family 39 protein [Miltoncostaeaceae bacterium]
MSLGGARPPVRAPWAAALALVAVIAVAVAFRAWAFGGVSFALGSDESRYVAVAQNLASGHMPHGAAEWFGTRLVLIWPVAGLFRWIGASDYTASAWPAVGSLLSVGAAYLLGRDLGSRRVGLVAAGLVAVAPLEVLLGTRLRPDAIMPGLVGLSVWLALRAGRALDERTCALLAAAAGLSLGAAWSVRESALVMAPVILGAGWHAGRRALAWGAAGLVAVPALAAILFGALAGDPLQPLTGAGAEGTWRDPVAAWSTDGSYAAAIVRQALDPGALLFLLGPVLVITGAVLVARRERAAILPAAWLAWATLYLELGTLVNLGKPLRFLTLCSIPAALLVALAVDGRFAPLAVAGVAAIAVAALWSLPLRDHRGNDVVLLHRVADRLSTLPHRPVLSESYTWWAKLAAFVPRGRLPVADVKDPEFLDESERRAARRLEPLPDVAAYAGGYVVTGPVIPLQGWPSNWATLEERMRRDVPWRRLRLVATVGAARIWRWPA